MIYLDYSATTPVDPEVAKHLAKVASSIYANPNSMHRLGEEARKAIEQATNHIKDILHIVNHQIVYTSGATEANNLAIFGYCHQHQSHGKHIIVSPYEHSSTIACFSTLELQGFEVDMLGVKPDGLIDLDELKSLLREDTIFVSIAKVNSETGITQDLHAIREVIKPYPWIALHSDMTQAIGKIEPDFHDVDLASFSAHKFYGLKGIGALMIRDGITIQPQIVGGKSLTNLRSGTPATPLILSLSYALERAYLHEEKKRARVHSLHDLLITELQKMPHVVIHSTANSIPHIVNVSFVGNDAKWVQTKLNDHDIFVSTQSACSSQTSMSVLIYRMTGSEDLAKSAIRISISHLTTEMEIHHFVKILKEVLL